MPPLLVGIAGRRLEYHWRPDVAFVNLALAGDVSRIEAPHEPHLEERAGTADGVLDLPGLLQAERQRLLAECRLSSLDRGHDDFTMGMRRARDDDGIDGPVLNQIGRALVCAGHVELFGDFGCQRLVHIRDGDKARLGDTRGEVACVDATESAQADQSDVQPPAFP
jgi:hypothetical protein